MRVIARASLREFWSIHPESRLSLLRWLSVAEAADWTASADIVATFPNAKILNRERARFEIGGGNFRLIVAIKFQARLCFIKFIGTHAEYDKIDALSVSKY